MRCRVLNEDKNPKKETKEKIPIYKQKKGMFGIIIVCCIGVLLILAAMGMFAPDKIGTNVSTDSNQNPAASGYQVKIITDDSWSGSIGSIDSSSYDGVGNDTIDVKNVESNIVSLAIQKNGGGSALLEVQILKDGQVVKEGSTTAAYGLVTLTTS